jgi:Holliday junction resolvase-like predicted endonuclease
MWHFMGKKARGAWGESLVDSFMGMMGWACSARNWRIPGGEIDRIYEKQTRSDCRAERHILLVEVKLVTLTSVHQIEDCLSEVFLGKLLKARQMRNLQKIGNHLAATRRVPGETVVLHARLFVAFRFLLRDGDAREIFPAALPGRICLQSGEHLLLSLQPEFVGAGGRSSRLQVQL